MRPRPLFILALLVASTWLAGQAAAATLQPYRSEAEFNTAPRPSVSRASAATPGWPNWRCRRRQRPRRR
jgi:hypothetical protein